MTVKGRVGCCAVSADMVVCHIMKRGELNVVQCQ